MNGGSVARKTGGLTLLLVFLGCFAGSANAGINQWTRIGPEGVDVHALAIDPFNSARLYAGTSGGVFKSTDGGASWRAANTGLTGPISTLAIDPFDPATVYAGTGVGGFSDGVFKSTDGGASWQAANTGLLAPCINALAIDPLDPATVYAGIRVGVFKSTDGGASWQAANAGLPGGEVYALAIDPLNPATLYASGDGFAVSKSTNGGTSWQPANIGLRLRDLFQRELNTLTPKKKRELELLAATDLAVLAVKIGHLAIDPRYPATVYASQGRSSCGGSSYASRDRVFKSTDGGASWHAADTGLPGFGVNALAIDPQDPATVYAGTRRRGVFKSTDGGASWHAANTGLTDLDITELVIDPLNPATVYVVAEREAPKGGGSAGSAFKITFRGGE